MSNNNYPPPPNPPNYQGEEQVHNVQPDLENNQEKYYAEQPQPSQQFEESFKIDKPKWNDWPFTVFFFVDGGWFYCHCRDYFECVEENLWVAGVFNL